MTDCPLAYFTSTETESVCSDSIIVIVHCSILYSIILLIYYSIKVYICLKYELDKQIWVWYEFSVSPNKGKV